MANEAARQFVASFRRRAEEDRAVLLREAVACGMPVAEFEKGWRGLESETWADVTRAAREEFSRLSVFGPPRPCLN